MSQEPLKKLPPAPDPLVLREIEPDIVYLPPGEQVWRIYNRAGDYPTTWESFRDYGPRTAARFDHQDPPPARSTKKILYGALGDDAICTCIAECFQEDRAVNRYYKEPWLVCFSLESGVSLLSLRGKWPTRAKASMDINSNERRDLTQGWSRAIYEAYKDIDGILYSSSMNSNDPAVAFYERASKAIPPQPSFNRPLSDPSLTDTIKRICIELRYEFL